MVNPVIKAAAARWQDEQTGIVFYILPFRNMDVALRYSRLELSIPHWEYIHVVTGACQHEEPPDHRAALEARQVSQWQVNDLWSATHYNFTYCDGATVDIEFPDNLQGAVWKAFQTYWMQAPKDIDQRWELYRALLAGDANNLWIRAYHATRDNSLATPVEVREGEGSTDPQSDSAESPTSKRTRRGSNEELQSGEKNDSG